MPARVYSYNQFMRRIESEGHHAKRTECHTATGVLNDTLYLMRQISNPEPPVPRLPHLAPYPPAAEGEYRIQFRGAMYIAAGMAAQVAASPSNEYRMVRIGSADLVPVYIRDEGNADSFPTRVWAPITDACIFLPFRRESEAA
jgi:hypothetical protein